jgi:hypothetical protein
VVVNYFFPSEINSNNFPREDEFKLYLSPLSILKKFYGRNFTSINFCAHFSRFPPISTSSILAGGVTGEVTYQVWGEVHRLT